MTMIFLSEGTCKVFSLASKNLIGNSSGEFCWASVSNLGFHLLKPTVTSHTLDDCKCTMNTALAKSTAIASRFLAQKIPGGAPRNGNPLIRHFSSKISNRGGAIIAGTSDLELHLPPADDPVGAQLYKKAIYCPQSGILRTSAHVGSDDHNQKANGVVGDTVEPSEAHKHARNSGLRLLATLHQFLDGDLDRIEQVLHLKGMVKATPDFSGHASVIDGCSEVLAQALGPDRGIGTRECFGVGSLGATVACTLEVRLKDQ